MLQRRTPWRQQRLNCFSCTFYHEPRFTVTSLMQQHNFKKCWGTSEIYTHVFTYLLKSMNPWKIYLGDQIYQKWNCIRENISLDYQLKSIVTTVLHVLEDGREFKNRIKNLNNIRENYMLVSFNGNCLIIAWHLRKQTGDNRKLSWTSKNDPKKKEKSNWVTKYAIRS